MASNYGLIGAPAPLVSFSSHVCCVVQGIQPLTLLHGFIYRANMNEDKHSHTVLVLTSSGVLESDAKPILAYVFQFLHAEQCLLHFLRGYVEDGYSFPLNIVSHSGVAAVSVTDENTITTFLCNPFIGLWTPDPQERVTNPHNVLTCWLLHLDL